MNNKKLYQKLSGEEDDGMPSVPITMHRRTEHLDDGAILSINKTNTNKSLKIGLEWSQK